MDAVNLLLLVLSCLSMTLILSGYPTSTELLVRPQQMLYPNNGQLPLLLFVVSEPYLQLLRWSATMGTTISWRVADNNGAINPARACHDARVGLNYQAPALRVYTNCVSALINSVNCQRNYNSLHRKCRKKYTQDSN